MEHTNDKLFTRIYRVRSALATKQVGYASMLLTMKVIEVPKERCNTAATDGKNLYVCREFIDNIKDDGELGGLLMHEAMHVALGHHLRRGNRDPYWYNIAGDYIINGLIRHHNLPLLSGGTEAVDGLLKGQSVIGMTTEHAYNLLVEKQEQPQPQDGDEGDDEGTSGGGEPSDDEGTSGGGEPSDGDDAEEGEGNGGEPSPTNTQSGTPSGGNAPPLSAGEVWDATDDEGNALTEDELVEAERELSEVLALAEQITKAIGNGDGSIRAIMDTNAAGKVSWLPVLRDFLTSAYRSDEDDWNRPNRRHAWRGDYLPSHKRTVGGPLHVCIDTSGSVGRDEIAMFGEELVKIAEELHITEFIIAYVDSKTHVDPDTGSPWHRISIESGERITLKYQGGGGTSFDPVFNLVDLTGEQPLALVYFTDGYGNVSVKEPGYPVVWATTHQAPEFRGEPFGTVIDVLLND